jgi:hypothetical protein
MQGDTAFGQHLIEQNYLSTPKRRRLSPNDRIDEKQRCEFCKFLLSSSFCLARHALVCRSLFQKTPAKDPFCCGSLFVVRGPRKF